MPKLYSALASHYIFEYVHPFYDDNGRTGKYLLALYLSGPLTSATALCLSRTILENTSKYYKSFETVQKPLNQSEMTHFIYQMLEFVSNAQDSLLAKIDASEKTLQDIDSAVAEISQNLSLKDPEANIVKMLMQYCAFGLFGDAPLAEIATYLDRGL